MAEFKFTNGDELPPWLGERLRDLVAPRPRDDDPEPEETES